MWEQGEGSAAGSPGDKASAGSASKSASSARGIFLLLAALGFCLLLYKFWGPLLFITCALVLCVHACYSLLVNDSLLAPHTVVLLGRARALAIELAQTLRALFRQGIDNSTLLLNYLKRQYKEKYQRRVELDQEDMNEGKRNMYRLNSGNNNLAENINSRNSELYHSFALNGACNIGKTSTPISRGSNLRKHDIQNGGVNMFIPPNTLSKNSPLLQSENKQPFFNMSRNDDVYHSPKHTTWNNSLSPKVKDKSEVIKTVQTTAGPLLTSSRYNIDPKIYTDINSPGLTSRLIKYAAEANNKLTHQSQYGAGQFPKVNLNASPIPLLSPKVIKSRMPVTVRVAPPEMTSYSPPDNSCHQEKSKIFPPSEIRDTEVLKKMANSMQIIKKIALKRHASREDTMLDIAKKQKAEQVYEDQLENLEEMMQKRARDESNTSDEELSMQSMNQRPLKRSKASSCHDVLNSLSSSVNVFTGVKRKNMDSSRCSSPETEKHFKSSTSPNRSSSFSALSSKEIAKSRDQLNVRVSIANASGEPYQKKVEPKITDTPKPDNISSEKQPSQLPKVLSVPTLNAPKETTDSSKSPKLTDKLFMKPEPQTKEKLKSLIVDQGNEVFFQVDDRDEIKKQDIDNMRQNSMRLRLKSMFDAISGKSTSEIDPDVVIQAEDVNPPTATPLVTLNSLTTTTTVNTSPITTTIVPILKSDSDNKSPTTKHVTFNLPQSSSTLSSSSSSSSNLPTVLENNKQGLELKTSSTLSVGGFNTTAASTPSFSFGSNPSSTSTAATNSSKPLTQTSGFSFSTNSNITTTSPLTSTVGTSATSINTTPTLSTPKTSSNPITNATPGFSFNTTTAKTTAAVTSAPSLSFGTTTTAAPFSFFSTTTSAPSFSFTSPASTAAPTFSFNAPASHAKSTESTATSNTPVMSTQNPLAKSPSNMTIPQTAISSSGNQPNSLFGNPTTNSPFSAATSSTTSAPVTTSTIATTSPSSIFSFNASNKPAAGGFSFNATTAATSVTATTATFSFGSNTQTNTNSSSGSNTFAMPAVTTTASAPAFNSAPSLFNAPSNAPSLFSGSPALGMSGMFKSPSTTTATTNAMPAVFGTPTTGFGASPAPTTTTPSLFGNNVASTSSSTMQSLFGNITTTTTPSASPFGATNAQSQQSQGSIFSGANATTSSTIFGTATNPSTGLLSGAGSNPNPAPAASPSEGGSIFGQTKPLAFGGTSSTFGTNNQTSSFSAPGLNNATSGSSSFQIGSAPSSTGGLPGFGKTTSFGGSTSSSSSVFGTSTGAFGASTTTTAPPAFGSSNAISPPTFGTSAASSGFGSSGTSGGTFSSAGQPAAGSFGSGTTPSAFGAASSSTFGPSATTSSPFGASTTSQPPAPFGGTATTNATSGGTFSFGGAQTTQQQAPNSSFSFGGTANASAPSSGGLFQFGANNAAKPAGFNFSAPTAAPTINFSGSAAPPAFNAPTTNMFSIGSGSSTPRSRTSRPRRQR